MAVPRFVDVVPARAGRRHPVLRSSGRSPRTVPVRGVSGSGRGDIIKPPPRRDDRKIAKAGAGRANPGARRAGPFSSGDEARRLFHRYWTYGAVAYPVSRTE